MDQPELKGLIKNFFEKINNREFDSLEKYLASSVVFYFPGTKPVQGPDKVIQLLRIIFRRYPDLLFDVKDIITEGDRIAVVWTNHGRDTKGNLYQNEGVTIIEIEKGLIIYLSDYFKDTSFTSRYNSSNTRHY